MKLRQVRIPSVFICALALVFAVCSCSPAASEKRESQEQDAKPLVVLGEKPADLDPQNACDGDLFAVNVYDRLMEARTVDGATVAEPSLAEAVDVSADGLTYTFFLRQGITFSNGSELTSEDVEFTFKRLIRNVGSKNASLVAGIAGELDYAQGATENLSGFTILDAHKFEITLDRPRPSFLAALCATGASILDKQTTIAEEADFEKGAAAVGTGPYVLASWDQSAALTLKANPTCWSGIPGFANITIEFLADNMPYQLMFQKGELDILDVSLMGMNADYFARGDIYRTNLRRQMKANINCIVFDKAVKPLDDARIREALALALDRLVLLNAGASGRGVVENVILPSSLSCGKANRDGFSYNPAQARALLAEAGYSNGFNLDIHYPASVSAVERDLIELIAQMWREIGVQAQAVPIDDGQMSDPGQTQVFPCRFATAFASYDDPEAIFGALFAHDETSGQATSLSHDAEIIRASSILDSQKRLEAYREIESQLLDEYEIIPLYSQSQVFIAAKRIEGFSLAWNGASGIDFRNIKPAYSQQ